MFDEPIPSSSSTPTISIIHPDLLSEPTVFYDEIATTCMKADDDMKTVWVDFTPSVKRKSKRGCNGEHMPSQPQKSGPIKRVMTHTDAWMQVLSGFTHPQQQWNIVEILFQTKVRGLLPPIDLSPEYHQCVDFVLQQLQRKKYGYRAQDTMKTLFKSDVFITTTQIITLLYQCKLECFYCKHKVDVLYENVRYGKQWSLERINNHYGHNWGNVEIACLECNVRRKTMHYERYVKTKEMAVVVKMHTDEPLNIEDIPETALSSNPISPV